MDYLRAHILKERGTYDEAEAIVDRILPQQRRLLGPTHPDTLSTMELRGTLTSILGKHAEAIEMLEVVMGTQQKTEPRLELVSGNVYRRAGRAEDAERAYRDALSGYLDAHGLDHPETVSVMENLADVLIEQDKLDQAEALLNQGLEARMARMPEDHPDILRMRARIGWLCYRQGNIATAGTILEEVVTTQTETMGARHIETMNTRSDLALVYGKQGDNHRKAAMLEQLLQAQRDEFGESNRATVRTMVNLGNAYTATGALVEGERILSQAVSIRAQNEGNDSISTMLAQCSLAENWIAQRRFEEAWEILRKLTDPSNRDSHRYLAHFRGFAGRALLGMGRRDEAERNLLPAYEALKAQGTGDHRQFLDDILTLYRDRKPEAYQIWLEESEAER
jgi:tetratricopeptide (TPR) repeat protein